ncbi:MAG: glycosyltransferase family 4 protein [Chloroflexi bacterium]|nr:glycosyltransferase family 1 protein [Chloroflexota bacterium]NOG76246.1 glycosyltransferase family 4 protein [Chloroflexota bacterium]
MTDKNIKLAYIHATSFPSTEANTFDAIWTAAALKEKIDTTFFVPRLKTSKTELMKYYDISSSSLPVQSMRLNLLPDRFLLQFKETYEKALSFYLRFHPEWAGFAGKRVIYVREPRELIFWGLQKEQQAWLKNWILCYEAHDPLGIDPNKFPGVNPFSIQDGPDGLRHQLILRAASNFDVLICNTQILADDLRTWTNGRLNPHFITLASPLPRLLAKPQITSFGEKITIGYIGTVDRYRGVDILLESVRFWPKNYTLRIVGRLRKEQGVDSGWLDRYMADPIIGSKVDLNIVSAIDDVAAEIDRCDIVVQPASKDELDSRYAAPLKSYGYMVRGKPIVAGDVLCHRELFDGGNIAALYSLDPGSLSSCIVNVVENPKFAERIAQGAWEQSVKYTLSRRVDDILGLLTATS